MRFEWQQRLAEPYSQEELEEPDSLKRVSRRLGLDLEEVHRLEAAIYDDLDGVRLGIGWWDVYGDAARRILVGDYLHQAIVTIQRNFIEATLHLLESQSAWDRESDIRRRGMFDPRANRIFPMPRSPEDELPGLEADAHSSGFFRALGSAFDCLAIAIIAIAPLSLRLPRAGWKSTLRHIRDESPNLPPPFDHYLGGLRELIDLEGSEGWTDWLLESRNMLVHRPRRMHIRFILPAGPTIALPGGGAHTPTRITALLQKDPLLSDVEEMRVRGEVFDVVLPEPAEETMAGVLTKATRLQEDISRHLLSIWKERRADPQNAPQPLASQWPETDRGRTSTFRGISPRSFDETHLNTIATSTHDARRIDAAGLTDPRAYES
jgi:hypothetical protein